ncbi:MAG: hypothetical protein JW864_06020 [Spirochaetes bacterium]|nr:hypothetical protein [Spirochaetota bacterium]
MPERNKKAEDIVKTIKLLESIFKTNRNELKKAQIRRDINKLRSQLKEIYPDSDLKDIENTIYANLMASPAPEEHAITKFKNLSSITIELFSSHKEDAEINEAASIMKYFQERIWVVISDQHVKLDYTNSSERDTLYRKLDECNRAFKTFCQTIDDIEKTRSTEYLNQLHLMRVRHGRLFLFEIHQFFKSVRQFISNLIANYESGGNMILNPDDMIQYAEYEEYSTYENWSVINALINMLEFINEALELINIPNLKQY